MLDSNDVLGALNIDTSELEAHSLDAIKRNPEDTVIHDYPCGFGKSTRMIQRVGENPDQQVLIVVPDLEQVRALIRNAEDRYGVKLYQPLSEGADNQDKETGTPFNFIHETKRDALHALIQKGHNVITTHNLYSDIAHIARTGAFRNVELHIDEVLSVADDATSITQCSGNRRQANDWRDLYIGKGYATICPDTGCISPTDAWRSKHEHLAGNLPLAFFEAAEAGRLYTDVPGIGEHIIMSELPSVLLKYAKQVHIYTYRFKGSYMAAFLKRHGVAWTIASYDDVSPEEADRRFRESARELVTINSMDRLNGVSLGYSAQKRMVQSRSGPNHEQAGRLRGAFRGIGRELNRTGTSADHLILTCLQDGWTKRNGQAGKFAVGTKLFSDAHWVANQTRGTNQYRHCSHVAYFWQQNPNSNVARFLDCDNRTHSEVYSIAEMIQFIWRSRVRDGQPITVYMPCSKMRRRWYRWLDGEI